MFNYVTGLKMSHVQPKRLAYSYYSKVNPKVFLVFERERNRMLRHHIKHLIELCKWDFSVPLKKEGRDV